VNARNGVSGLRPSRETIWRHAKQPHAIFVVDFLLEQNDMTRAELAPLMGGRSRVSDFFNGRRQLSLGQIQKLRERFGVSADALIPVVSDSLRIEVAPWRP
jgi:antitoxin component HigA of HigAB toxin-antitoxin module